MIFSVGKLRNFKQVNYHNGFAVNVGHKIIEFYFFYLSEHGKNISDVKSVKTVTL